MKLEQITIEQLNQAEEYLREKYIGKTELSLMLEKRIAESNLNSMIRGAIGALRNYELSPLTAQAVSVLLAEFLIRGIDVGLQLNPNKEGES